MNKIYGYTVVAYPESMPEDWEERLQKLPFGYVYCVHDKDVEKDTGKIKKAHIHFYFQGHPGKKQKVYIHESLGITYGEDVRSADGMYSYLTHENNPDKYHYPKDSIIQSSKWNQELFESHLDFSNNMNSMRSFIVENHIYEYADLIDKIFEQGRNDLEKQAKQPWVRNYIESRRFKFAASLGSARRAKNRHTL